MLVLSARGFFLVSCASNLVTRIQHRSCSWPGSRLPKSTCRARTFVPRKFNELRDASHYAREAKCRPAATAIYASRVILLTQQAPALSLRPDGLAQFGTPRTEKRPRGAVFPHASAGSTISL